MKKQLPSADEVHLNAEHLRFGIVCARFNGDFVAKLLDAAIECIIRYGGNREDIVVVRVPGSYEIPLACQKLAETGRIDAVIGLGMIIKGDTDHADQISTAVTTSLTEISLKTSIPITHGVVTVQNTEQATVRSGPSSQNRGAAAAAAAIEMANLFRRFNPA